MGDFGILYEYLPHESAMKHGHASAGLIGHEIFHVLQWRAYPSSQFLLSVGTSMETQAEHLELFLRHCGMRQQNWNAAHPIPPCDVIPQYK